MRHALGVILLLLAGSAQAALIDRGGGFIYDDVLDITWTQNADINGYDTWDNQVAWADSLSLYDSVRDITWDDWRLASLDVNSDGTIVNCPADTELACRDNELGYMWLQNGVTPGTPGLFTNFSPDPFSNVYWSGTEYVPNPDNAWFFDMLYDAQFDAGKDNGFKAWAVRDGDVAASAGSVTWLSDSRYLDVLSNYGADSASPEFGTTTWDTTINAGYASAEQNTTIGTTSVFGGTGGVDLDGITDWHSISSFLVSFRVSDGGTTLDLTGDYGGYGQDCGGIVCTSGGDALLQLKQGDTVIYQSSGGVINYTGFLADGEYTIRASAIVYGGGYNGGGAWFDFSGEFGTSAVTFAVGIDIDPWSPANIVKPDSNDQIHVLVMGSNTATGDPTDFDVYQIDPDSLKFGVGEAPNISGYPLFSDADNDTNTDALFAFQTQDTGILCGDPDVTLMGETFSGDPFEGTDTINTADCDTGGCHP